LGGMGPMGKDGMIITWELHNGRLSRALVRKQLEFAKSGETKKIILSPGVMWSGGIERGGRKKGGRNRTSLKH